jgi:hypothetical protein
MKKLLSIVLLLASLSGFATSPRSNAPTLILEMADAYSVTLLTNDAQLSGLYEFRQNDTLELEILVLRHRETGIVLGTIYGLVDTEFLQGLSLQFTPEYIADLLRSKGITTK